MGCHPGLRGGNPQAQGLTAEMVNAAGRLTSSRIALSAIRLFY
jgi:hypothetical protein